MQMLFTFKQQLEEEVEQRVELVMTKQEVNQQELEEAQEVMYLIKYFQSLKVKR